MIIIIVYYIWGEGGWGRGGVLTVCLFFFSDAGINVCFELMNELMVALILNSKTALFTREWIQFIVPAKYSIELKHRFIMYSTQLVFT